MSNAVSGMAASIRAATDSETFDLAGHDAAYITNTAKDAFSQPFDLDQMIRVTFIVGGGKLSRQKYDAKAMQHLTKALQQLDFVEDKGASCINDCGGCYKTQHDTGKNVFTVVVFPQLVDHGEEAGDGAAASNEYPIPVPLPEGTAEHIILLSEEATFQKMIPSACPSWSEKKECSEVLKAAVETVQKMDEKLMSGTPLSDDENGFYNECGGVASIGTKAECVKKLMHKQVDEGALTKQELDKLLDQVNEKIGTFNADIDAALEKNQQKKVAKLNTQKEKAEARKKMLDGHTAQSPHKLKHEAQLMKLRKKLQPLLKLEKNAKGRLMTMKESKDMAAKDEIEEEISELEAASRGWFEDDDAFEARLQASRKKIQAAQPKAASKGGGKKPGTGARSTANTNWLTPGGLAAKQAALGKKAAKKSKPKSSGGVFAAMMLDSDSDSD